MKDLGKLSFSKEVAETLGLESAIILELYKTNKISNSRSIDDLLESIRNEASFLPHPAIEESLQKLIKYKFIKNVLMCEFSGDYHGLVKLTKILSNE